MATSKTTAKTSSKKQVVSSKEKTLKTKAMNSNLSVQIFDNTGKAKGTMSLPEIVFGQKVNKTLLHQAVRVYLVNQRQGTASTKSRGEIDLTKAKWYRQKGTGRARHGAQSAPIFVGGGVAHGPKPRNFELSLSKTLRIKALQSAFSSKFADAEIVVVDGMNDLEAKTKPFAKLINTIAENGRKLVITAEHAENLSRGMRNIEGLTYKKAMDVTTYDIIANKHLVIAKDAIAILEKRVGGEK